MANRGYDVLSDDLFVMPANVAIRYDPRLIKQLDQAAQAAGAPGWPPGYWPAERHLPHDGWGSQLASTLFSAGESVGSRLWGRHLTASAACTGCGPLRPGVPHGQHRHGRRPATLWLVGACCACAASMAARPGRCVRPWWGDGSSLIATTSPPPITDPDLPADYLTAGSTGMYRRFYAHLLKIGALPAGDAGEDAHGGCTPGAAVRSAPRTIWRRLPGWPLGSARVIYNLAPLVPGHSLVVPRRHAVGRLLDLSEAEAAALWSLARRALAILVAEYAAEGFDLSLQDGAVAGPNGAPRASASGAAPRQ